MPNSCGFFCEFAKVGLFLIRWAEMLNFILFLKMKVFKIVKINPFAMVSNSGFWLFFVISSLCVLFFSIFVAK